MCCMVTIIVWHVSMLISITHKVELRLMGMSVVMQSFCNNLKYLDILKLGGQLMTTIFHGKALVVVEIFQFGKSCGTTPPQ